MNRFLIEKESFEVRFALMDSTEVAGHVFLSGLDPATGSRQRLHGLLSEDARFLPIRQADGQVLLVCKTMIASASLPIDAEPPPEFTQRVPCTIQVSGVGELEGDIIMPQGPEEFRVSDHLNSNERWFRFEGGDRMYFVNCEAVALVRL